MADQESVQDKVAEIIARAWSDLSFKKRLHEDAREVLLEMGVEIPSGKSVRVVEDTADTYYLYIPPAPTADILGVQAVDVTSGVGSSSGQCCKPVNTNI